jgi:hypothetical protein
MIQFIISNLATILISIILITTIILIFKKMIKDKKQGKSCSCGNCCGKCSNSTAWRGICKLR